MRSIPSRIKVEVFVGLIEMVLVFTAKQDTRLQKVIALQVFYDKSANRLLGIVRRIDARSIGIKLWKAWKGRCVMQCGLVLI